jgi:hypothetical protein
MIMIKNELGANNKKKLLIMLKTLQETGKVIIDVMKNPSTKKKPKEMEEKKRVTLVNIPIKEEKSKTEVKKKIMTQENIAIFKKSNFLNKTLDLK